VVGPDNHPMPGVLVTLRNDVSGFHQDAATGTDGTFTFFNVPYNPYQLRVEVQGFATVVRDIDIRSAVPVDQQIKLTVAQLGVTFSNSIDPGIAQGIEIIYGNVPAEFGEKVGAVINLTTKSGLGAGSAKTDAYVGASKFATVEGGVSVGGGTQMFGYFGSVDA